MNMLYYHIKRYYFIWFFVINYYYFSIKSNVIKCGFNYQTELFSTTTKNQLTTTTTDLINTTIDNNTTNLLNQTTNSTTNITTTTTPTPLPNLTPIPSNTTLPSVAPNTTNTASSSNVSNTTPNTNTNSNTNTNLNSNQTSINSTSNDNQTESNSTNQQINTTRKRFLIESNTDLTNITSNENTTYNETNDFFICDENFYKKWITNGIKCGGLDLNITKAVQSTECVIYSGDVYNTILTGMESCLSICKFPSCDNNIWDYATTNGIRSSIYKNLNLAKFMTTTMLQKVTNTSAGIAGNMNNMTIDSDTQCSYNSELSFDSCSCPIVLGTTADNENTSDYKDGNNTHHINNDTPSPYHASVVAGPVASSTAAITVGASFVASAGVVGTTSVVGSVTTVATTSSIAMVTIDMCQFVVMINQFNLEGQSETLSNFGKHFTPSIGTFLPFGTLNPTDNDDYSENYDDSSENNKRRRLLTSTNNAKSIESNGIRQFCKRANINHKMLFYLTLSGILLIVFLLFFFYGFTIILASCLFGKSAHEFAYKWFDKVVGVFILISILSQYAIGVTATYQIYLSIKASQVDIAFLLAVFTLVFLALGIIFYGIIIIRRYEDQLRDVGTIGHLEKPVAKRYGALYDEYTFESRFFFAPKMLVSLLSGMTTGLVSLGAITQALIILFLYVGFLFYLEMNRPYHTRFLQQTTSLVTIMKISVIILSFFLISNTVEALVPEGFRNIISSVIIAIHLLVLLCLMVRQLYIMWQRYKEAKNKNDNKNKNNNKSLSNLNEHIEYNENIINNNFLNVSPTCEYISAPKTKDIVFLEESLHLTTKERFSKLKKKVSFTEDHNTSSISDIETNNIKKDNKNLINTEIDHDTDVTL